MPSFVSLRALADVRGLVNALTAMLVDMFASMTKAEMRQGMMLAGDMPRLDKTYNFYDIHRFYDFYPSDGVPQSKQLLDAHKIAHDVTDAASNGHATKVLAAML